ncbi:DUF2169 domain-containing protein [Sorangium sp. So ce1036]|uniref:DUF2169 family type VI secretion system accessory protein n=1 Tax=Sorangium sp. So ce1036 TaxID=3133328 RepID=UPI003F06A1D1
MLDGAIRSAIAPDQVIALPGATAAAVAWRTRGQLHATVIAKATFAFTIDAEMPRSAPQEIFKANIHHGNDPSRSVRFTSDLIPYLPRADVVFTGCACAPPGTSVLSLPVRLALFDRRREILDKRLLVQGSAPFRSLPLVYERAVRGANGQENPFGVNAGAGPEQPIVLDPQAPQRPAGYGPIARGWPPRGGLSGNTPRASTIDESIREVPDHLDWSCFQSAPPDQRVDYLRGGEWILLEGLHPTVPRLRMRLPEVRGLARVHGLSAFGVSDGQGLALCADTLRIDGDAQRCTLVFRGSFPLASEAALARVRLVAGVEQAGAPLSWPPQRDARAQPEREAAVAIGPASAGLALSGVAAAATLDIAEGAPSGEPRPVHPFRPEGAPPAEPRPAVARAELPSFAVSTLAVEELPDQALQGARVLPFQEQPRGEQPRGPLSAGPPGAADQAAPGAARAEGTAAPAPSLYTAWPAEPALLATVAERAPAAPTPVPGIAPYLIAPAATERPSAPPAPEPEAAAARLSAPPAAEPEAAAARLSAPPVAEPEAAAARLSAPPAPEPEAAAAPEPAPPELDPASFPLERFAAVSAEIAEARAPRAAVLASHALSERAWAAIDRHWTSAIKKDAGHGPGRLRSAYDSAYVAAVEAFRGPITPAEYARLVVGVERKQSEQVLDELGIQRPALMHVMRSWTKKVAADPGLFSEVGAALTALRAQ